VWTSQWHSARNYEPVVAQYELTVPREYLFTKDGGTKESHSVLIFGDTTTYPVFLKGRIEFGIPGRRYYERDKKMVGATGFEG